MEPVSPVRQRVRWLSRLAAMAAIALGLLPLAGWLLRVPRLRTFGEGLAPARPAAALCLILAGCSLRLITESGAAARWIRRGCAMLVILLAGAALAGNRLGPAHDAVERLLVAWIGPEIIGHSSLSPVTSIEILCLGIALLLLDLRVRQSRLIAQTLSLVAAPVVFLSLVAHAYRLPPAGAAVTNLYVPLPTSLGMTSLVAGLLFARPDRGLMALVTSGGSGSSFVRRAFAYALFLPALVGWLALEGWRRGLFDATEGVAFLVFLLVVLFSALIWREAYELERLHTQRQEARDERERAQKALRQALRREQEARERAEEASRSKDQFLANLSHELRTPLNAILGWARLLRDRPGDPAWLQHGLEIIERNARTQALLVGDLLDMSRILAGRFPVDREEVELGAVVQAALEEVLPAAQAKGIRVVSSLEPAADLVVGDPVRLEQVAWNLLSNAVKFTPSGGRVEVTLERVATEVVFTVRDNGVGIPPRLLAGIFNRFSQGEEPSTRHHGGLGLGLAIARHLVEQHGGTIRAESPGEGLGSSFTVTLPLQQERPAIEPPRPRTPPAVVDLLGLKVLVVDDEPDSCEVLSQLLELRHAQVTTAASAGEALQSLQRDRPHVLVSDIAMPGEDGLALIGKVRALERQQGTFPVPAIALTAFARQEDRSRAIAAGFQLHIAKPVEPEELIAAIHRLARGPLEAGRGGGT